jgi:hypothetical protein
MNKNYKACVDYILENESQDFYDWVEGDGADCLSEDSCKALASYGNNKAGKSAKVIDAFKEASKFHVFACAWLCEFN